MLERWNFYFCKVNDVLSSVALDLGLRKQVPDPSKPELLWIWVYFKSPRPDGLSSSSEFDSLVAIEKHLTESLEQKFHALLCGRITTDGRREFYYYGAHSDEFESAVADALGHFPGYEFDCGTQKDPGWKQYLDVLYPSDEDRQRIENRSVLEVLEQKRGHPQSSARYFSLDLLSHKKRPRRLLGCHPTAGISHAITAR
jgi:hypothetical protein